jgi:phosphonopyruvate decarboxylase
MEQINAPVALIVKKGTFNSHKLSQYNNDNLTITREDAIKAIVSNLEPTDILVSTTGKTSRELYEYRDSLSSDHSKDFLTVGSMGHASQIALGIALAKPKRQVFCFDGDGAAIMHLGALAIAGPQKIKNFKHIIFNNGCHDSVGGQPTSGFFISFTDIARGCGYTITVSVQNLNEIKQSIEVLKDSKGPSLLEIKVKKGSRSDLGRPKVTPRYNKASFMEFLSD